MVVEIKPLILIVSPPRDLQIGLQALLTSHLDVDVVVVGKGASAMKVIEKYIPVLVIMDQDIQGNEAAALVQDIKTIWPKILCIMLINDEKNRKNYIDLYADLIVVKGLPGPKLISEIKMLLNLES